MQGDLTDNNIICIISSVLGSILCLVLAVLAPLSIMKSIILRIKGNMYVKIRLIGLDNNSILKLQLIRDQLIILK